jgi:hypothetical protein
MIYFTSEILVSSNMNSLLPKMNLLKDISSEYASSAKSVENMQRECEILLNKLEFELTLRL